MFYKYHYKNMILAYILDNNIHVVQINGNNIINVIWGSPDHSCKLLGPLINSYDIINVLWGFSVYSCKLLKFKPYMIKV